MDGLYIYNIIRYQIISNYRITILLPAIKLHIIADYQIGDIPNAMNTVCIHLIVTL